MAQEQYPIVDSHIHLYAATHISRLAWTGSLSTGHILGYQSSVDEYRNATSNSDSLQGFIVIETDRKSGLDESEWADPLEELRFFIRIAHGKPQDNEGYVSSDSHLVLGIIPWAPLPTSPESFLKYISLVKQACNGNEKTLRLIKGFRYLVQDKPQGTMLNVNFIQALNWLGANNFVFDLGVDAHSIDTNHNQSWQLHETHLLLEKLSQHGTPPKIVLNHFCKPNLKLSVRDVEVGHGEFVDWKGNMKLFAGFEFTYMKLSGFFSELEEQREGEPTGIDELVRRVRPWVEVVFEVFGPSRVMFGSDWPVCSAGGPGKRAWGHWVDLVAALLEDLGLNEEEKMDVWSGTARRVYDIDSDAT